MSNMETSESRHSKFKVVWKRKDDGRSGESEWFTMEQEKMVKDFIDDERARNPEVDYQIKYQ